MFIYNLKPFLFGVPAWILYLPSFHLFKFCIDSRRAFLNPLSFINPSLLRTPLKFGVYISLLPNHVIYACLLTTDAVKMTLWKTRASSGYPSAPIKVHRVSIQHLLDSCEGLLFIENLVQ